MVDRWTRFTRLYGLLWPWIDSEREPWNVIRRKLRFVGVTSRTKTSPNTFRWQQTAEWIRDLPARAVLNVSLDRFVWSYLADRQVKLTRTSRPEQWLAEPAGPQRGEHTSTALAEALTIVEHGRTRTARTALPKAMTSDPAIAEPWLRHLIVELGGR